MIRAVERYDRPCFCSRQMEFPPETIKQPVAEGTIKHSSSGAKGPRESFSPFANKCNAPTSPHLFQLWC